MDAGLTDRVAVITGGARGQGRSHALRLAAEGVDVVVCDLADQLGSVQYAMGRREDLDETVELVKQLGRRCVAMVADVRDTGAMRDVMDRARSEFGAIDIVLANAGIMTVSDVTWELTDEQWDETIGVNLTGAFKACRAAIPHMIDGGRGGSIVITSSVAGLRSYPAMTHYTSSKHGVVGLMRNLARELAPHRIRVNTVHPTGVRTGMGFNRYFGDYLATRPELAEFMNGNLMDVDAIEPSDVSEAIAWLVSDRARWVTGASIPIDAGFLLN